jgi:peptidoglycan hydrolase-like protein with peptidoglycan-binding domain
VNGGNGVLGEEQPGRGDGTQRPAEDGAQWQGDGDVPAQQDAAPPAETASQILQNGDPPRRSPAAARVGLTTAVVLGVAVAAGIGGLSLLANTGGSHDTRRNARADAAPAAISGPPLRVLSVLPSAKSSGVSGATNVLIAFSSRLAQTSPAPTFRPAVAGQWRASGRSLKFTPSAPFAPRAKYTLVIPAGRTGLRSATGGAVAKPLLVRFSTGGYSQLRLAQVLSQLGYLPTSWQPTGSGQAGGGPSADSVVGQELMAFSPPAGSFTWSSGYPASLRAQWVPGQPNVVVHGAVMAFQAQHKLAINGKLSPKFWHALFAAAASSQRNTVGYSYAVANKGSPETLTIWHNGHQVLRSLTNTGIPIDPTVSGTFPVYLRFRYQIMSGTNPDGSHYADPVTFVSYFNGADAVHYLPRGSYGSPQSLGCVELPYNQAQKAWPYLTYGSLVTVTG